MRVFLSTTSYCSTKKDSPADGRVSYWSSGQVTTIGADLFVIVGCIGIMKG
jgi:hypothetical protein